MREVKLDNGLTLVLIENHRVPMVSMSLGILVGGVNDPANQAGLSEAVAALLNDGAGNRSSVQLARAIETLGGQLSISANDDYTEIYSSVIAENLEAMLDLFGDIVLHPTGFSRAAIHLKGSCLSIGAKRMVQICSFIDAYCASKSLNDLSRHILKLEEELVRVVEALETQRNILGQSG